MLLMEPLLLLLLLDADWIRDSLICSISMAHSKVIGCSLSMSDTSIVYSGGASIMSMAMSSRSVMEFPPHVFSIKLILLEMNLMLFAIVVMLFPSDQHILYS